MSGLIPARGIVQVDGAPSGTTILEDDFTVGSNTRLTLHTPITGSWVNDPGQTVVGPDFTYLHAQASTDYARPNNTQSNASTGVQSGTSPSSADQRITANVEYVFGDGIADGMQLRARIQGSGACYMVRTARVSGNSTYELVELSDNETEATVHGSYADVGENDGAVIIFTLIGSSLTVNIDGVDRITATDSTITAAGEMGIGVAFGGDGNADISTATALNSVLFEEL